MHRSSLVRAALVTSLLAGCGEDMAPVDGGELDDATTDDAVVSADAFVAPCEIEFDPLGAIGGDGVTEPLATGGQARAGRLTSATLPADPTEGLLFHRAGDFVLANDRVALLVEAVGDSDLYDRYGGRPIGMAQVEGGRLVRLANYNEVLFGLGVNWVETSRVAVIADGTDGNPAIIRATGTLAPIDFAGNLIPSLGAGSADVTGWNAAIEYSLAPGSDIVDITMRVQNGTAVTGRASNMLMAFFQRYRMPMLTPGQGFVEQPTGSFGYLAFDGGDATSYAWMAPMGTNLRVLADVSGTTVVSRGGAAIPACSESTIPIGSIAIAASLDGAVAVSEQRNGRTTRTIRGDVFEADGTTAVVGAHVHATFGDGDAGYFARALTDTNGHFEMAVPPDGEVRVRASRRGLMSSDTQVAGTSSVTLRFPATGSVHVVAREDGSAIPARIAILPAAGRPPTIPEAWGEPATTPGRFDVEFATDGEHTFSLTPGDYIVIASHGYEYDLHRQRVTLTAGATTEVAATLRHVIDTTDHVCADYHIHTSRSADSEDDASLKIAALVSDGLEIPIRSDHEFIADFEPVIQELGLAAWARGLSGEEMTSFEWGHFGVFPATPDPSQRNGSAVRTIGRTPPQAFADVRARAEQPALIINHPRSTSPGQGYFEIADYDAASGDVGNMAFWDEAFSVVEVFNDTDFERNRNGTVQDWFSFLNAGRRVFAVGSSDSHHIYGSPVGYPRTCLELGFDDPRMATPTVVRDATERGHGYISGGIYLDVVGPGGERPGDEVRNANATTPIHVVVRAAEWIDVDRLEVFVDGVSDQTYAIGEPSGTDPTIRLDEMVEVPVSASAMGSWVVFVAAGTDELALLHPGRRPFAVSNPIFLYRNE